MGTVKQDRLFVRQGRRPFRRTYSVREAQAGFALLLGLALVLVWVVWRGMHPDPELFELAAERAPTLANRGPLPEALAPTGWKEAKLASYGPDDLYVKVNGRADFYLARGFRQLVVATLADATDATRFVDVELFDQGTGANAVGTYDGERPATIEAHADADGSRHHFDKNALFLTRGRYYIRAIGSDDGEATRSALENLRETLTREIAAGERSWADSLFVDGLGLSAAAVSYSAEGAFSFGFARDVYVARLEDDTELFVTASRSGQDTVALASQFVTGFSGYGEEAAKEEGVVWIRDRYIQTIATAVAVGPWVVGIKGAPDLDIARRQMQRLREGAAALDDGVLAKARAAASPAPDNNGDDQAETAPEGEYGDEAAPEGGGGDDSYE